MRIKALTRRGLFGLIADAIAAPAVAKVAPPPGGIFWLPPARPMLYPPTYKGGVSYLLTFERGILVKVEQQETPGSQILEIHENVRSGPRWWSCDRVTEIGLLSHPPRELAEFAGACQLVESNYSREKTDLK